LARHDPRYLAAKKADKSSADPRNARTIKRLSLKEKRNLIFTGAFGLNYVRSSLYSRQLTQCGDETHTVRSWLHVVCSDSQSFNAIAALTSRDCRSVFVHATASISGLRERFALPGVASLDTSQLLGCG
jgi:hypothetical protein